MKSTIITLAVIGMLIGCSSNNPAENKADDNAVIVTDSTDIVYGTPNSDKYHNSRDCHALKNATDVIEMYREQAVVSRKPCKNCADSTKSRRTAIVNKVYTVAGSNIYHSKPSCFHIRNSKKVQVCEEDSVKAVKQRCKDCWKK